MTVEVIKDKIIPILQRYDVRRAAIFGSLARGDIKVTSDVDLLVEIGRDISLLDFIGLKLEIEDALGMKVDLVEYSTIKPLIKEKILSEQVVIL